MTSTSTLTPPDGYDILIKLSVSIQLYFIPAEGNAETWYIERPKLELGDIATDWTAAPEDQIEQIAEELTSVCASHDRLAFYMNDTEDAYLSERQGVRECLHL